MFSYRFIMLAINIIGQNSFQIVLQLCHTLVDILLRYQSVWSLRESNRKKYISSVFNSEHLKQCVLTLQSGHFWNFFV
jgi:hypothetical protein